MNKKELIEYIKINDSLKEIDIILLKPGETEKVFIISESSFQFKVYIKRLVQRKYTKDWIQYINSSGFRLLFTFDEIKLLKKNQKEFFIVNGQFLSKLGINIDPESSNILYYENNSQKYLYFSSEGRILMIEPGNDILQNTNTININNNMSINYDINSNNNITNNVNYFNLESDNNNINNIIRSNNNNLDNNYINNNNIPINYNSNSNINISTNEEIMNIEYNINNITVINNNKKVYILNSLILIYASDKELNKIISSNLPDKYDLKNYIIINIKWLNEFKDKLHYNQINKILSQYTQLNNYNDYLNNLESIKLNNEIQNFASNIKDIPNNLSQEIQLLPEIEYLPQDSNYNWPNNFYLIHESLFNIFKKFTNNGYENYEKKYKIIFGKLNIYLQSILNPGNIYVYFYNSKCFIFLAIILFSQGIIFDLFFDKYLKTKPFIQYLKENKYDLSKVNFTQDIIDRNKQKIGVLILKISPNEYHIQNEPLNNDLNLLNINMIKENYNKFIDSLSKIPNQNIELSGVDSIEIPLSIKLFKYISVNLIESEKLNYCFKLLNIINGNNKNIDNIKKNIIELINNSIKEILSESFENKRYSFINQTLYKKLGIPLDIFEKCKALFFINKKTGYVYYRNQKKLLKINNYNKNVFNLSKYEFNNNNGILNDNPKTNQMQEVFNEFQTNAPNNFKANETPNEDSINNKEGQEIIKKPLILSNHCKGLGNIGATCYMNSTLQCLCHSTSFRNYFLNKKRIQRDTINKDSRMSDSFHEIVTNLWISSNEKYYEPYNFKNVISELNPLFKGIQANDSKDLIIFIYETLHKELNNPNSDDIKLTNVNNSNIPNELKEFRNNYYSQNKSIIVKIFYFEQSYNLKCCSCKFNKVSYNIIDFLIFPLEKIRLLLIKKKPYGVDGVSLEDCFEMNEESEIFSGQNQIFCNNCHRCSDALSYNKLYNCPEVLTIILNRGKGLQFDVKFKLPMFINIEKYVIDKSCETNYELIGVLTHLGPSGMSGHFIAYCKSPVDNNWYCYNDSQVSECTDVGSEINSRGIPYVLFYQRINNDENVFVLYFIYEGREVYLDLKKDKILYEVKNQLCQKYSWIPSNTINYYIMKEKKMNIIDMNKTIEQNGIKNGDKICIINSEYENNELNKNLEYENNQLKRELNEEKQKNEELNNIIKSLTMSKNINIRKISELEQSINYKNKELKELNDKIDSIISLIKSIGPNEKIYTLNFISGAQNIDYCIPCKNTDIFSRLEEKLYKKYPKYKDYETYFLVNGRKIQRFKSLDENNIKNGDTIMMVTID